jgi:glycosyltransferase involved in cell wall biosynthesis
MNILQVVPYFPPAYAFGGPVSVAYSISKELVKRGHNVTVYTTDAKNPSERLKVMPVMDVDGIEVHYMRNLCLSPIRLSNFFIPPEVAFVSKSELRKFDVIHLHEFTTFQNVMIAHNARKVGVPYVLQTHGSIQISGRRRRKLLFNILFGNKILRGASKVIALSSVEKLQYRSVGLPDHKIVIIPNGIDLSNFANLAPKGSFKSNFKIGSRKKIILYLGRIHKTKGIDLLIRAFAFLVNTFKDENLLLVIAGPDDGNLATLKSLVNALGITELVLFTGFVENKDKLNALSDAIIFVTPSFYGFPVTFLEACAAGTPIITTQSTDFLDWINGNVGLVTSLRVDELAHAMHRIIEDSQLRETFSSNGKKMVESNFSIKKIVDKLEQVYTNA